MSFAVIDFETTGLVPERTDRVVEVGIVLADDQVQVEDEWTTLVNPRRDVGASHIHGIHAGDLLDAPEFADVGDHILGLLAGRVVVAHNASFDMRFLHCELQRAKYPVPQRPAALCSMKWAGRVLGAAKLAHCCEAFGIEFTDSHCALDDARATAELVAHLMRTCRGNQEWHDDLQRCGAHAWPTSSGRPPDFVTVLRGQATDDPHQWLRAVLQAAWIPGAPEDEAAYLLVLENALLDLSVSRTEGRRLLEAAEAAGLSRATVGRLHHDYLRAVALEALDDGVVTDAERHELDTVAAALGLGIPYVEEALAWAAANAPERGGGNGFALHPGDRVVFTGDMARSRDEWLTAIGAAGLTSGGITKTTRLVVAADPDSLSGKAAKARQYGIPVVDEDAFTRIFATYQTAN